MTSIWRSFVPYHTARDLMQNPGSDGVGRDMRFTAVALFADVSGFTAMSEALAATGKRGAEELTTILNSYFEPMIALIHSYGGIIGKFGGDAMTVLFPADDALPQAAAHCAAQCALEMQARMSDYVALPTSVGVYSLTMKIGTAVGPIFCANVGDPDLRLEYIIAGSVLDDCADAEHHARSGEIVLHENMAALLPDAVTTPTAPTYHKLLTLPPCSSAPLPPLPDLLPETAQTIAAFIHPSLAQRLRRGQLSFLNEHRKVTILFVSFAGFDYDGDTAVGDKLQHYFNQVVRIVHQYDGYLNKVDMGDKGSKTIILFGAPIGHEDDEERALRCALELSRLADTAVKIGVNSGFVYSGQVGSARRQEYTVMGDAVNLAARLMQAAAPGQILVSQETRAAADAPFAWEASQAIRVKGKAQPVQVHVLGGTRQRSARRDAPHYALPMVGRAAELALLQAKWQQAQTGYGQLVGITAEAGMGKSRLMAALLAQMGDGGQTILSACQSYGTTTAYLVWQGILHDLFGLQAAQDVAAQVVEVAGVVTAVDPTLAHRLPLLAPLLNLPIPDNEHTRAMDAKLRKSALEGLVLDILRHNAQRQPLLLILEDTHWLDPLSNDLLEFVGRGLVDVPIMLLVIYRPPESERIQPQVRRLSHFSEIRLSEFSAAEAEQLIGLKLGRDDAPPILLERITARAQGNPFYMDEMINLIRDQGIDPADEEALASFELPGSLHNLIISRVDRLAEGPKTTLKVASVIGRLFREAWLWGSYPQLGEPPRVRRHLAELGTLELMPVAGSEPELEYLFKHIVTREVAYESLAVATRAMLHEQIGLYVERAYATDLPRYLDLLAYHFGLSRNEEKQREYFAAAAAAAKDAYANDVAITYYERLLPLLADADKIPVLLNLGEVQQLIGEWDAAEANYRAALSLADAAAAVYEASRARQLVGVILRAKGDYEAALGWLVEAREGFTAVAHLTEAADALRETGVIYWYQGDYERALAHYEQSRQIAEEQGDQKGVLRATGNMGLIYWSREENDAALACFETCQQLALALDDRFGLSLNFSNMGNVYLEQGDYVRALNAYAQSLQIALELGDRQGVSISVGNMGNIYWYQGRPAQALACYSYDLQTTLALGDRQGVSFAAWNVARVYLANGELEPAERLLTQALALGRALDTPYDLCTYLFDYGNLLSAQQRRDESAAAFAEAAALAEKVENETIRFEAGMGLTRLQVERGGMGVGTAVTHLQSLFTDDLEAAQTATLHYEIWQLDPQQAAHKAQAIALYRDLYARTPSNEYRDNYRALTGEELPEPPPLPPLPTAVTRKPVNMAAVFTKIDLLLEEE
ncbi:MAG: tetratricopeptide repeat protein [Ardenticatenaceae bacterium]|nr:tetratricopeptide repeat protein [Ardenticatenaceae bacterium]MCB9004311.1 tetratricopeptide repeat protein [Ardenticatenaceae bacterium]